MKLIGSGKQHSGSKVKFGFRWDWIHWIKPNGEVMILVSKKPIA